MIPINLEQSLVSLRKRIAEAKDHLDNLATSTPHKKFKALEALNGVLAAAQRIEKAPLFQIDEPEPLEKPFVAYALYREEIAAELNKDYIEEHHLKPTDPRLTDAFCEEFASGFGECLTVCALDGREMGSTCEWEEFITKMHQQIGATEDWFV